MADLDGAGGLSLFVAGRWIPGRYPELADSTIYRLNAGQWQLDVAGTDYGVGDDFEWLAGPGGVRAGAPSRTTGAGLQLNINKRAFLAFELLSGAPVSDAFGLVPEAYRDIKFLGSMMQEQRLLLLRPDEVSSRIAHAAVLEVGNHALGRALQHVHVLVRRLA